MRKSALALTLGFTVLASACKDIYIVPSLRPLYTKTDTIFEPNLLGTWTSPNDSKTSLTFATGENNSYKCIHKDGNNEFAYVVYLIRINGHLFMDMLPLANGDKGEGSLLYSSLLLPVHTFFIVRQINPTLNLDLLDSRWVVKAINDNINIIQHEVVKEKYILFTAPPEALQEFLLRNVNEAFLKSEGSGLIKIADTQ